MDHRLPSLVFGLALAALRVGADSTNYTNAYSDIFTASGIVPDLIPSFNGTSLGLQFPGLNSTIFIGEGLLVEQASSVPTFYLSGVPDNKTDEAYVVIMADPDVLTPQDRFYANLRHLISPNMKLDADGRLVNSTPALWDYIGPAPPNGSAPHRYTILVYRQPSDFLDTATPLINSTNYISWSLDDFTLATGLEEPVAGTFFLSGSNITAAHTIAGIDAAFESSGLVPDLIPSFSGVVLLDASYPSTAGNGSFIPNAGMNLTVEQVASEPEFLLTDAASNLTNDTGSFVLFLLDPDAPTPANASVANVLHFLAHGLRPSGNLSTYAPLVNSTPALAEYVSPAPPAGSAPHRYTTLLYAEPEFFAEKAEGLIPADRISFNLTHFVEQTGLGAPLAGNFFYSAQNITIS